MTRDVSQAVCPVCGARTAVPTPGWPRWYAWGFGVDYKSAMSIGSWPLVHIASGFDPVTMTPRVARGVIAVGNVAVGAVAVGGVAVGILAVGGVAVGLLTAIGGVAMGVGLSIGGVAFGSIAIGAVAAGLVSSISSVPLR